MSDKPTRTYEPPTQSTKPKVEKTKPEVEKTNTAPLSAKDPNAISNEAKMYELNNLSLK